MPDLVTSQDSHIFNSEIIKAIVILKHQSSLQYGRTTKKAPEAG